MTRTDSELLGSVLGKDSAFHNPYTFIPFSESAAARRQPDLLTSDEGDQGGARFTGTLHLRVTTRSPLLTIAPQPIGDNLNPADAGAKHKKFEALCIGDDVIVPATAVRGALRSLLTVLLGAPLATCDQNLFLCQGRDAQLGPANKKNNHTSSPQNVFLARVEKPGAIDHSGTVRLGTTRLVEVAMLELLFAGKNSLDNCRPTSKVPTEAFFIDNPENPTRRSNQYSSETPWQLKLSGRPVNTKGKREGAFKADGRTLELSADLWADYLGRHRHAVRPELKEGDLVWLEPNDLV